MAASAKEADFQNDILREMVAGSLLRVMPELPATNGSDCCGLLCFLTHARVCA
jgi:hypothetical protein